MKRLLLSETMDPDGAMYRWCSPDVEALGWDVLRIPTQELIHHIGIEAYNAFLRSIIRYWRPHAFMVHPPYDYLIPGTVSAAKKVGTRLIAFGFDDPLFVDQLAAKSMLSSWTKDMDEQFDLYASTSSSCVERLASEGLTRACHVHFATTLEPFKLGTRGVPPVSHLSNTAVIVGRPHDKRLALVERLLEQDIEVSVFGHGWAGVGETPEGLTIHGPLTREAMNSVYQQAGVVITTGDWEDIHVPMVKYRLLEVAMVGGFQIAQESVDLRNYFPETMVPSYADAEDLADKITKYLQLPEKRRHMGEAARKHANSKHRWLTRFPELIATLDRVSRPIRNDVSETSPAGYRSLLMFLGHHEEEHGSKRLAEELFSEVARRFPGDVAARHGLTRLADRLEEHEIAYVEVRAALEGLKNSDPVSARGIFMSNPRHARPRGLGETGYLHPQAELSARYVLALAQTRRANDALKFIESLTDPDLIVAVAGILTVPRLPVEPQLWLTLLSKALEADPTHLARTQKEEAQNWQAECRRLRAQIEGSA